MSRQTRADTRLNLSSTRLHTTPKKTKGAAPPHPCCLTCQSFSETCLPVASRQPRSSSHQPCLAQRHFPDSLPCCRKHGVVNRRSDGRQSRLADACRSRVAFDDIDVCVLGRHVHPRNLKRVVIRLVDDP